MGRSRGGVEGTHSQDTRVGGTWGGKRIRELGSSVQELRVEKKRQCTVSLKGKLGGWKKARTENC